MKLSELNALPAEHARAALERCCGSSRWVEAMVRARPFADRGALVSAAERASIELEREDWLEAFSHHPRIGDAPALSQRFATTSAWAGDEQRGAAAASEQTLEALARRNQAYEQRFGYIFIVCATDKRAVEMLTLLEARLPNDPALELDVAAAEQLKITRLRLDKLLEEQ